MSALPPHREAFAAADSPHHIAARWAVLARAGRAVAEMASRPDEAECGTDIEAALGALHPAAAELACRTLDDILAVLEPGIGALLTARERGHDPAPAATALWDEFRLARTALLALAPLPAS